MALIFEGKRPQIGAAERLLMSDEKKIDFLAASFFSSILRGKSREIFLPISTMEQVSTGRFHRSGMGGRERIIKLIEEAEAARYLIPYEIMSESFVLRSLLGIRFGYRDCGFLYTKMGKKGN